jgi:hypothetical protein
MISMLIKILTIARAFCLFMNMDRMVGGEFEKGLENLKSVTAMAASQ